MPKVFALFVGINKYVNAKPLFGCVEDTLSVEKLFRSRIPEETLALQSLYDEQATRGAIIDGFRSHLGQARAGDVALFYYCGHGSLEWVPDAWKRLEPGGMNRTIVPVDARAGGIFDLADKELNGLIGEVAATDAHVVVITDSCHSGGATRGDDVPVRAGGAARMTMAANDPRTLADYLPVALQLYSEESLATMGRPAPRHVALAACQQDEIAWETPFEAPRRGAFSAALEAAITTLGPAATYADLIDTVRLKVRAQVAALGAAGDPPPSQVPNLYVAGGASGYDLFLQGHAGHRSIGVVAVDGAWWLLSGAIDGTHESTTEVAIYERSDVERPPGARTSVATGIVAEVREDRARLAVTPAHGPLDVTKQYIAEITRLAAPGLHVVVQTAVGATEAGAKVRASLAGLSARFAVVEHAGTVPAITVAVSGDAVDVRGIDGAAVPGMHFALDPSGLAALGLACTHLANWYTLRDLTPANAQLNGQVVVEIVPVQPEERMAPADRAALPVTDGAVALKYDGPKEPRVQFRIRNTAKEPLFVAVLEMSDSFACSKIYGEWIPAGEVGLRDGGKTFRMGIADWRPATTASGTDCYKVVAAVKDFDPERWTMPALLGQPTVRDSKPDEEPAPQVRGADGADAFWGTSLLRVVTSR
jgi:hypothetical protein